MNKETENKELEPILKKLSDVEEALKELKQYIDNCVVPTVGAQVDRAALEAKKDMIVYMGRQKLRDDFYFDEGTRFAIFFTSVSVFVNSLFGWISFLVMATANDNHLGYWIAFAVSVVLFICSPIIGGIFLPGSIKYWWGILKDKMKKSKLKWIVILLGMVVRFVRRIWRIIKRA